MEYDDLINMLKRSRPVLSQPDSLRERILQATETGEKSRSIWPVVYGARIVLTIAAIFLILFLIVEQHSINSKLAKLENSIARVNYPELMENYQDVRYDDLRKEASEILSDSTRETLVINRRTLNFLLNRIKELESENNSIQDKLSKFYSDSLTFHTSKP